MTDRCSKGVKRGNNERIALMPLFRSDAELRALSVRVNASRSRTAAELRCYMECSFRAAPCPGQGERGVSDTCTSQRHRDPQRSCRGGGRQQSPAPTLGVEVVGDVAGPGRQLRPPPHGEYLALHPHHLLQHVRQLYGAHPLPAAGEGAVFVACAPAPPPPDLMRSGPGRRHLRKIPKSRCAHLSDHLSARELPADPSSLVPSDPFRLVPSASQDLDAFCILRNARPTFMLVGRTCTFPVPQGGVRTCGSGPRVSSATKTPSIATGTRFRALTTLSLPQATLKNSRRLQFLQVDAAAAVSGRGGEGASPHPCGAGVGAVGGRGGWGTQGDQHILHLPVGWRRAGGVVLVAKPRHQRLQRPVGAPPPPVVELVLRAPPPAAGASSWHQAARRSVPGPAPSQRAASCRDAPRSRGQVHVPAAILHRAQDRRRAGRYLHVVVVVVMPADQVHGAALDRGGGQPHVHVRQPPAGRPARPAAAPIERQRICQPQQRPVSLKPCAAVKQHPSPSESENKGPFERRLSIRVRCTVSSPPSGYSLQCLALPEARYHTRSWERPEGPFSTGTRDLHADRPGVSAAVLSRGRVGGGDRTEAGVQEEAAGGQAILGGSRGVFVFIRRHLVHRRHHMRPPCAPSRPPQSGEAHLPGAVARGRPHAAARQAGASWQATGGAPGQGHPL